MRAEGDLPFTLEDVAPELPVTIPVGGEVLVTLTVTFGSQPSCYAAPAPSALLFDVEGLAEPLEVPVPSRQCMADALLVPDDLVLDAIESGTPQTLVFDIYNTGSLPFALLDVSLEGDPRFSLTDVSPQMPVSLPPGAQAEVSATLTLDGTCPATGTVRFDVEGLSGPLEAGLSCP